MERRSHPIFSFIYKPNLSGKMIDFFSRGNYKISSKCKKVTESDHFIVLGIETSCDDTGVAIVSSSGHIVSERIVNQHDMHEQWGGIVPKFAKEAHKAAIDGLVEKVISEAGMTASDISAIAVTVGPGLSLCLREGVSKANTISWDNQVPIVATHHLEAHTIVARQNIEVSYPLICLLVSGGHNIITLSKGLGDYHILGTTLDDSVGEALDKVARLLKLKSVPSGGAAIEKLALNGNPTYYRFPLPLMSCRTADFSFSGLKSNARILFERENANKLIKEKDLVKKADLAASFQFAAFEHLISKVRIGVKWGISEFPRAQHIIVSGGVASNHILCQMLSKLAIEMGLELIYPPIARCSDNGAMVAWAGIERLRHGLVEFKPSTHFLYMDNLKPRWPLGKIDPRARKPTKSSKLRNLHHDLTGITKSEIKTLASIIKKF